MSQGPLSPDRLTLHENLRALGVRRGDLLMLHVSLRGLGLARSQGVDAGAEQLLDAIDTAVGPTGTSLMVLGTDYPFDWVNHRPVEERAALLAHTPPFDVSHAPVLPEVGYFAEAFRRRSGTVVSQNPSGRFGARGARAAELVADQPWNDYYGPGSPLERLCAWGGRVLRLQADLETTTVLHYAEYLADVPDKRRTRWDYVIASPEGPRHVWIECLDDFRGITDWSGDDYFAEILREYLSLGRHLTGRVGAGEGQLIDAADLVGFGARWMTSHLAPSRR
jgi:aminoglycoside N3'-acetyltransferase